MKQLVIQARISEKTKKELDYLKKTLGLAKTTAVIELALHRLAVEQKMQIAVDPFEAMEDLGLIGCFEARSDFSSDYKDRISKGLGHKHSLGSDNEKPKGKKGSK